MHWQCRWDASDMHVWSREDAQGVAYALGERMIPGPDGLFDLWHSLERLGWHVHLRELRAPEGGLQACLVPRDDGGFLVWVDDRPSPAESNDPFANERGPDAPLVRFRLAHEFAHSLFYAPGRPPVRRAPASGREEAFCDDVAALLLVPSDSTEHGTNAAEVALARRAPVAAVQRAARWSGPQAAA